MAGIPTTIEINEKVAHCKGFPLIAVIKFKGCQITTGKLFTQAELHYDSCTIEYLADGAVMESGAILTLTYCPGCNSPLPTGSKSG
jgi:hypothetical protein